MSVTEFFRTPRIWPPLVAELRRMRSGAQVWSAGCATGQEAWSVAMLAAEVRGDVTVVGTDVDADQLATARAGRYESRGVHQDVVAGRLSRDRLRRWMVRTPDGLGYRVVDALRGRVDFELGDLATTTPPARCGLVLARNVWRHLSADGQARLAVQVAAVLPRGGYLVFGGGDLCDPVQLMTHRRWVDEYPAGVLDLFQESTVHELIWERR